MHEFQDLIQREKGIKINAPDCDCKILGGPLLKELFLNLIENSIKHSKGNTIRIQTK